jgi:hypothetical protein
MFKQVTLFIPLENKLPRLFRLWWKMNFGRGLHFAANNSFFYPPPRRAQNFSGANLLAANAVCGHIAVRH